jgi:hypothetical protein
MPSLEASCRLHNAARLRLVTRFLPVTLLPELLGDGDGFVLGRSVLRLIAQSSQIGLALASGLLLVMPADAVLVLVAAASACSAVLLRLGVRANPPLHQEAVDRGRGLRAAFAGGRRPLLVLGWIVPMAAIAAEALAVPYVTRLGLPAASAGLLIPNPDRLQHTEASAPPLGGMRLAR